MIASLPYDVQLSILKSVDIQDLVRYCSTCKILHSLVNDRSVWHNVMSRLLSESPQPRLYRRLFIMSTEELRAHAILAARLDTRWHGAHHPHNIRSYQCMPEVEHVNLLPGGKWVVAVLHDGSLHLHELGAPVPVATLAHTLSAGESVLYLSSRLSVSHDLETLVILQMGVRYNQCNIYVYHIQVADEIPSFHSFGKVAVTGSVWCCAAGGNLLVYGVDNTAGDMVLCVKELGPNSPQAQLALNIGPWSADEDFTVSVLSPEQLLIASHDSLSIYDFSSLPFEDPTATPLVHAVQPIWYHRCDIGMGIYRISPLWWDENEFSHSGHNHRRPTIILGEHGLHVLQMVDNDIVYHTVGYPFVDNDTNRYLGTGAVGYLRAIWDSTERRDGAHNITFRTSTLPRWAVRLQDVSPTYRDCGRVGSLTIDVDPREHLTDVCLDEWSGRICLLLNHISSNRKRMVIVDTI